MTSEDLSGSRGEGPARRPLRDWLADHIGIDDSQKLEIYANVARSASMRDATYWAEILFSAGIATLGLTLGSPAVIIGAMLISPLMGPIMAAGLALAAGDFVLTIRAAWNIVVSSMIAVVFATMLVVLLPFREMTTEIAARTQPNTLDLFVALFSGAIGALATAKSLRGVATSIPGVAIAVALMPPLCVTGYGIGILLTVDRTQGIDVLRGGSLLFVTNLVAITFTSMLVFLALHFDTDSLRTRIREWRREDPPTDAVGRTLERLPMPAAVATIGSLPARLIMLALLVAAVYAPLGRSFEALSLEIAERRELNAVQRKASSVWEERFATAPSGEARSFIDTLEAKRDARGRTRVTLRVFTSRALSSEERTAYEFALARSLGRSPGSVVLTLVEIPTSRFEVATRARPEPAAVQEVPLSRQLETLRQRTAATIGATPFPPGASILDTPLTLGTAGTALTITYLASAPISEDARTLIERDVRARLGAPDVNVAFRHVPRRVAIGFVSRSASPAAAGREEITALGASIAGYPDLGVTIEVPAENGLTESRAAAIASILREGGVDGERVRSAVVGGRDQPRDVVTIVVSARQVTTISQE